MLAAMSQLPQRVDMTSEGVNDLHIRHVGRGRAGGASAPPPDFGGSEGAAGQRRCAALLPAPPRFLDFATCLKRMSSVHYHLQVQANPKKIVQKN